MNIRKLIIGIVLFFAANVFGYSQEGILVKGRNYIGFIFPKEYSLYGNNSREHGYTLNEEEVKQAEKILRTDFKEVYFVDQSKLKDEHDGHIKHYSKRVLRRCIRQYLAYKALDGSIHVNVVLYKLSKHQMKHDIKTESFMQQFKQKYYGLGTKFVYSHVSIDLAKGWLVN